MGICSLILSLAAVSSAAVNTDSDRLSPFDKATKLPGSPQGTLNLASLPVPPLAAGKQETEDALLKRLRPIYDMAPVNSTDVLGLMGIPLDQILRAVAVEIKVYSNAYRLMPKDDPAMEAGKSHAQSFLLTSPQLWHPPLPPPLMLAVL